MSKKLWTISIGEESDEETSEDKFLKTWDDYRGKNNAQYLEPNETSHDCIEVLQFLKGQPLNEVALNYMQAVRPSTVRVIEGPNAGVKMDAHTWRVTIYVDLPSKLALDNKTPTITKIEQEVEVGCVGFKHGHHLRCTLSEQKEAREDKPRQTETGGLLCYPSPKRG